MTYKTKTLFISFVKIKQEKMILQIKRDFFILFQLVTLFLCRVLLIILMLNTLTFTDEPISMIC